MHWDGAERGLSSSVAGKGEDLVGGRELVLKRTIKIWMETCID